MERRLFFTSPIDHDHLEDWPALARELRHAVHGCCSNRVTVALGEEPVFGYGTDSDEALATIESTSLDPRDVRIELWSSIRHYAILCLTLGAAITRNERRSLIRRLNKKVLRGQWLLEEHEGPYYPDARHVYAYSLPMDDDRAVSTFHGLLNGFDSPPYLGENWVFMGRDEQVDREGYEILSPVGPQLSLFLTNHREAAEAVWRASAQGEGLIVLIDSEDPALEAMASRFAARRDLETFLALGPWRARVTLHRGHPEDHLAVIYAPSHQPEIDEPVVFLF